MTSSEIGLSFRYGSVNDIEYSLISVPGLSEILRVCPAPLNAFPVIKSLKLLGQSFMSKFLCMGMPIEEVIRRSTVNPARAINHPELGTLSIAV